MFSKKQKIKIKKYVFIFIMFFGFIFLVKVNINAFQSYKSTKYASELQETQKNKLEKRREELLKNKLEFDTKLGKDKKNIEKFGIKKPGEKVLIVIPNE